MKTKDELQKKLDKLQREIDNFVEKEQELNRWYKDSKFPQWLFYKGSKCNYGIDADGNWSDYEDLKLNTSDTYEYLATEKEVETALIKEAKKRGFKEGVKFKGFRFNNERVLDLFRGESTGEYRLFNADLNEVNVVTKCNVYNTIFKEGKWAEIIEDSKPTINGYEMVFNDNGYFSFGCKSFPNTLVFSYYELCKKLHIDSFKIDEHEITVKQLKEIVNYLNK